MSEPQKVRPPYAVRADVNPQTGKPMPVGGRKKGVPNKSTVSFREAITRLLEANSENIQKWVAQLAEGSPAVYDKKGNLLQPARPPDVGAALQRLGSLAEFAAPRLSRQEQVGDGGGPLTVVIRKESDK